VGPKSAGQYTAEIEDKCVVNDIAFQEKDNETGLCGMPVV